MPSVSLIFPHQLFADHPSLHTPDRLILVEDPLFFRQYPFHRQKLIFLRATMADFARRCRAQGKQVEVISSARLEHTTDLAHILKQKKVRAVRYVDPDDDWLGRRLTRGWKEQGITAEVLPNPHFLTSIDDITEYVAEKKRLFFTDFYIQQRKRLGILLDQGKPLGGKWTFDTENRKRLPKGLAIPPLPRLTLSADVTEARDSVRRDFPDALGDDRDFIYPTTPAEARRWLDRFITERLASFGDYEDAISQQHDVMFHSVLTPMLNVGLVSPREVIDAVLAHSKEVPLNSLEGFVRQVIGWREFIRLVYRTHGRMQRTSNFWGFTHPMPAGFYRGTTGLPPVDRVIRRILQTGYCHHIERLMVLGNIMLLCEIHPNAVYQWFMELFIDAYDWVMVPNVYGMSQYADGGLMTTKPYLSGSAYIRKMSDYPAGPWCAIWDALYWRFIDRHSDVFAGNPRMSVMVSMAKKLGSKLTEHHRVAEAYLERLHAGKTVPV